MLIFKNHDSQAVEILPVSLNVLMLQWPEHLKVNIMFITALYTMQIVSKQLHSFKQERNRISYANCKNEANPKAAEWD